MFIVSRERAKLGYFWRHAYQVPRCGPCNGNVVNPDTGKPILTATHQLRRPDFRKAKHSETVALDPDAPEKGRREFFSALWQADGTKVRRMAPVDFIGRYMPGFFDYAIADEMHELANDTAQGQALGTLASCAGRTLALTGTYSGGYADEAFNNLFRLNPSKMLAEGYEYGEAGVRAFSETYGVLEKVTTIEPADNACSDARVTKRVKRRPGASPLLFGKFLMDFAAFLSLEDITEALPSYREEVLAVEMDGPLREAYEKLEGDIKEALKAYRGNQSVLSVSMNALLLYPDKPFGLGDLTAFGYNPETQERERILISSPRDLDAHIAYAKERRLVEEVKFELSQGSRCQIFAVFTLKHDVTHRLKAILAQEGIRVEVLTSDVPPERREAWYEQKLRGGMQACIAHPKLVMTGLDYVEYRVRVGFVLFETSFSRFPVATRSRECAGEFPVSMGHVAHVSRASHFESAQRREPVPSHLPCGTNSFDYLTEPQRHALRGKSIGNVAEVPFSASSRVVLDSDLSSAPSTQKQKLLDPKRPNRKQTPKLGSHPLAYDPHGVRSPGTQDYT